MVAFALRADGWYLRSDVIWAKPNPMPESVTDRPTRSHEYLFLLTKSAKYFYNHEAVKEQAVGGVSQGDSRKLAKRAIERTGGVITGGTEQSTLGVSASGNRNRRSVWTITTKPYRGAHFATFPPEIPELCILAGTAEAVCERCGTPHQPIIEKGAPNRAQQVACGANADGGYNGVAQKDYASAKAQDASATKARILAGMVEKRIVAWEPDCECGADPAPAVVLDPFGGSGTTAMVANRLFRNAVVMDLSTDYLKLAQERVERGK